MSSESRRHEPAAWRQALATRWRGLQERERLLVSVAVALLVLALLWAVALQPALRTLSTAPARLDRLDAELAAMQALAADARAGAGQGAMTAAQAGAALQAAAPRLGSGARLTLQGDRAVLMLDKVGRRSLQEFLVEARAGARARTVEARLDAGAEGLSGTLVLALGSGG